MRILYPVFQEMGAPSYHPLFTVAKHRAEKSLPALETFVIDVISGQESLENEEDAEKLKTAKMSSTFIREWISKNIAKDRT